MTEREHEFEIPSFAPQVKAFGERLREVRTLRGMSQDEVADRAHIYRSHVSDIERGRKQPTVETLYRLAHALRVHVADLLDDRDEEKLLDRIRDGQC